MSSNLAFQYVRTVLEEKGCPLSANGIAGILTQFRPEQIDDILRWAVDNGSLVREGGVYSLTERGRQ